MRNRSDKKSVIFKKLEKVGESYEFDGHLFQSYRTFEVPIFTENYATVREIGNNSKISIEIKQNKENMSNTETLWYGPDKKEAKSLNLSNLKPFSLEAAKQGKPVCTRDGRKARIICFDKKCINTECLIVLVSGIVDEAIHLYTKDGKTVSGDSREFDLMMLPEKKEGWVNVYKGGLLDTKSYPTKKEAFDKASPKDYVDTIKINWSE